MQQIIKESYRKVIFGHRGYNSPEERKADMQELLKRGVNYFVCYKDTQSNWALQYSICGWVTRDSIIAAAHKYGIYEPKEVGRFHGPHQLADIYAYVDC